MCLNSVVLLIVDYFECLFLISTEDFHVKMLIVLITFHSSMFFMPPAFEKSILKNPIVLFYSVVQVPKCYQADALLIIIKEQCVISYGYFPAPVFYLHKLLVKIQTGFESRNWYFLPHACPPGA